MMAARLKRRSSLGGPRHAHLMLAGAGAGASTGSESEADASLLLDDDADFQQDDSEERRRRQKRRSHAPTPTAAPAPSTPATAAPTTTLNAAQLAEHYTNCMKMSAENKISMKNAFQLRLIDTMTEMIKKKAKDMDNFQSASCALDASTKIYAYRVDNVHHETLKLASGVGSNKDNAVFASQGGEDGSDDANNKETKKKRKRRANTVEKNLANINMAKFDLEFDTDPLFKKISAQFDSGGGGGQFLHTLPMRDDSCQLLLDSGAVMGSDVGADPEPPLEVEGMPLPKLEPESRICPDFSDFSFRNWSLADDDELNESLTALDDRARQDEANRLHLNNDEHAFDPNDLPDDLGGDGGGGDDHFDFGAGAADFADQDDDDDIVVKNKPRVAMALMDLAHLRDHLASVPSEYSYFDSGRLGAWAGPQHWKFKAAPMRAPVRPSASDAPGGKSAAKKKKEAEKLEFEDLFEEGKRTLELAEKALTVPKKSIKLQNKTIESWAEEKNLLPEDLHYSGTDFIKLEHLPKMHLAPRKAGDVEEDVGDYDFDNLNDSQGFCPDVGADQTSVGGGFSQTTVGMDTDGDGLLEGAEGAPAYDGGLVSAPNRIEKIQIGYAKLAKKVDMRRLKRVEWSILQDRSAANKTAENKENESGNEEDDSVAPLSSVDAKFSEVFDSLKVSRELPSKMLEGLSVPLAFVALLHLCNEETLKLDNTSLFDDLTITKA